MSRKGGKRAAEMVVRLVEIGARTLAEQLSIPHAQAEMAMRGVAHVLCQEYGGQSIYVAKDTEFDLQLRDLALWQAFSGSNVTDLAVQFGISERQVEYIVAHMRRTESARTQPRLPGLE